MEEILKMLAPPQRADEIGRLGGYRVLQVLGQGAMGIVFKAEDEHIPRFVALKIMLPHLIGNAVARKRFLREAQAAAACAARERFFREARAAAACRHENIVQMHMVGEDRGVTYLAMQLLEGETLEQRLRRVGRLPLDAVTSIGLEVARGLSYIHDRGLIHRDIEPGNIFLENSDLGTSDANIKVKILDFGLARAVGDPRSLTSLGAILGTPGYMSPEQSTGQAIDPRTDLFSLGCVLYEMCTGQNPFKRADTASTLVAAVTHQPSPPHEMCPEVPANLSNMVMKLLEKDPNNRFQSARDLVETLQSLIQSRRQRRFWLF